MAFTKISVKKGLFDCSNKVLKFQIQKLANFVSLGAMALLLGKSLNDPLSQMT
jgi:hypothetical protein